MKDKKTNVIIRDSCKERGKQPKRKLICFGYLSKNQAVIVKVQ